MPIRSFNNFCGYSSGYRGRDMAWNRQPRQMKSLRDTIAGVSGIRESIAHTSRGGSASIELKQIPLEAKSKPVGSKLEQANPEREIVCTPQALIERFVGNKNNIAKRMLDIVGTKPEQIVAEGKTQITKHGITFSIKRSRYHFVYTCPLENAEIIAKLLKVQRREQWQQANSDKEIVCSPVDLQKLYIGSPDALANKLYKILAKKPGDIFAAGITELRCRGILFRIKRKGVKSVFTCGFEHKATIAGWLKTTVKIDVDDVDNKKDMVCSKKGLEGLYYGNPLKFARKLIEIIGKTPNQVLAEEKAEINSGGVTFKVKKNGTMYVFTCGIEHKTTISGWLNAKEKIGIPEVNPDNDIVCSGIALTKHFIGKDTKLGKAFEILAGKSAEEIVAEGKAGITIQGIPFLVKRNGKHFVITCGLENKAKLATLLGVTLREPSVILENVDIADAAALLHNDPMRFKQWLNIFHPEISNEDIEYIFRAAFKGIYGAGAREVPEWIGFEQSLSQPAIVGIPAATDQSSFLLEGKVSGPAGYIQLTGAYTKRIQVRPDGTFSARILLPRTGETNQYQVFSVDTEGARISTPIEVSIDQTSQKLDDAENLLHLIELKGEVLEEILNDPKRGNALMKCQELAMLKEFTISEGEGFRRLRQRIEGQKSKVNRAILEAIEAKFNSIAGIGGKVKPGERLYFYQKYCIYEVQRLFGEGRRGVIMALEQGLGKTLAALAMINGSDATIITPNPVVSVWTKMEEKFFSTPNIEALEGSYRERDKTLATLQRPQVVTNVEFTRSIADNKRRGQLLSVRHGNTQEFLVVDEADYLGSTSSQQAQGTRLLEAEKFLLLTATPFKRMKQIRQMLNFVSGEALLGDSPNAFKRAFDPGSREDLNALALLMDEIMIRIRKSDVFLEYDPAIPLSEQKDRLPRKVETDPSKMGEYELTMEQCRSIQELFTDYVEWCMKHKTKGNITEEDRNYWKFKDGSFSRKQALRQIMNDPKYAGVQQDSPKHRKMDEIVAHELEGNKDNKVLIFCEYRAQVEEYVERYARHGARAYYGGLPRNSDGYKIDEQGNVEYYKVDEFGNFVFDENHSFIPAKKDTGRPVRALDYEMEMFQNDPKCRVIVATYDSGTVGVTITGAHAVIRDDAAETYRDQYQSDDRAHRIDNDRKKYEVRYYSLKAKYPKAFLDSLDEETREQYFSMGTYDEVQYDNIANQSKVFHRIMDGVGSEAELVEIQHLFRDRMGFLLAPSKGEKTEADEAEETEDVITADEI